MNILLNLIVAVLVVRSGDSCIFMNLIQVQNIHNNTHYRDFPTFTSQAMRYLKCGCCVLYSFFVVRRKQFRQLQNKSQHVKMSLHCSYCISRHKMQERMDIRFLLCKRIVGYTYSGRVLCRLRYVFLLLNG